LFILPPTGRWRNATRNPSSSAGIRTTLSTQAGRVSTRFVRALERRANQRRKNDFSPDRESSGTGSAPGDYPCRAGLSEGAQPMLRWAAIFLVIALIAALFGFTDIASASASIAQVLFAIFLVLFLGAVLFGAMLARRV
jgi:uncharacterized membrane protein YtjA (UPF0391 family)